MTSVSIEFTVTSSSKETYEVYALERAWDELAATWQQSGTWNEGDFDGSGFVDLTDLTTLAANWQTGIGSFGAAAESIDSSDSFKAAVASVMFGAASVPEPGTIALLALTGFAAWTRRPNRR